ncbi:hypothetical protein E2320_017953 [Naja naja]|nr:hypothetical protein E2320_017953 [Naja naja]
MPPFSRPSPPRPSAASAQSPPGVPCERSPASPGASGRPLPSCPAEPEGQRATNCLDRVPRPEYGSEGFFHRFGHPGLLTLDFLAVTPTTTTMKDSFPRPVKTGLPVRGKREAMMEHLLYQKHSTSLLAHDASPPSEPMESLSITHRDYRQEGFHSEPLPPTQPHDYRLEQPQTFWREHAQQVPGTSSIRTGDTPFRKCATFTTPVSECLDQP